MIPGSMKTFTLASTVEARERIARAMTPAQVAAAQKRASDWIDQFDNNVFHGSSPFAWAAPFRRRPRRRTSRRSTS